MLRNTLVYFFCALSLASPAGAYYGYTSTEVTLRFEGQVDAASDAPFQLDELRPDGKQYAAAREKVEEQLQFLIGAFQSPSFVKEFGSAGTLGDVNYAEITFIGVTAGDGTSRLKYRFEGPAVFSKKTFSDGVAAHAIPIWLPYSPDDIFGAANSGRRDACITDKEYDTETDFFYFWDPNKKGCPLAGDSADVLRSAGSIEQRNADGGRPRPATYPDYDRLYGSGPRFNVTLFLGYVDDIDSFGRNDVDTKDDSYQSFRKLSARMKELGFVLNDKESLNRFRLNGSGKRYPKGGIDFLQVWEKPGIWRGRDVSLRVNIVLTDSMYDSNDDTFHELLRPALRDSNILVYDGHSGLGANLDLSMDDLASVSLDKDKYQVFFFNGCSGYSYFPKMYFDAKGGDKNFRLLTSGLPTDTETSTKNDLTFLEPFLNLQTPSWQELLKAMDASNADADSDNVLYGVSGDGQDWRP